MKASALVGAIVIAFLVGGCGSGSAAPAETSGPIETVTVRRANLDSVYVASGTVVAAPVVVIRADAPGRVTVPADVRRGRKVAKGDRLFDVDGKAVSAQLAGTVADVEVRDGEQVSSGLPVLTVRLPRFAVQATVPATDAFRVYTLPTAGVADITGGPGGAGCSVFSPAQAETEKVGELPLLCVLDASAAVVEGLPAKVGIKTGSASDVLVLPVSAVQGDAQRGVVNRVDQGTTTEVDVGLGISDGLQVEIATGLAEGDQVTAFAPGLG